MKNLRAFLSFTFCLALLSACTFTVSTDIDKEDQEDDTAQEEMMEDGKAMDDIDQPDEQEDVDSDPGEDKAPEAPVEDEAPAEDVPADDGTVDGSTVEDTGGTGNDAEAIDEPSQNSDSNADGSTEVEVKVEVKSSSRTIQITADNWVFTPSNISVVEGEQITLVITGIEGSHGFAVPELGINVGVEAGQTIQVDLPTSSPGTYAFFCSIPCGAGHKDMNGSITISAA